MRISLLQQSEYGNIRMKHFRIKPGSVQFRFSSAKERLAELFALRLQDAILLRGIPKLPMFLGRNICTISCPYFVLMELRVLFITAKVVKSILYLNHEIQWKMKFRVKSLVWAQWKGNFLRHVNFLLMVKSPKSVLDEAYFSRFFDFLPWVKR